MEITDLSLGMINQKALRELDAFLQFCAKHQIAVIGFLPPFADKVTVRMDDCGNHAYLSKRPVALHKIFERNGFEFFNFDTATLCSSNDLEMIDGFHRSEVTYLRILIKMLEKGSSLNEVSNIKRLQAIKINNSLTVFP